MTGPIVTVTLNPAIDQTMLVEQLVVGEANRVTESRSGAGGKGINVSRVLQELGAASTATGFAPGLAGQRLVLELIDAGISVDFVPTTGETRTNLTIVDTKRHVATTIHNAGPETDPASIEVLREKLATLFAPEGWLVIGGSLPPGLEPEVYATLVRDANGAKMRTAVDTEGDALRAALSANPDLIRLSPPVLEWWAADDLESEEEQLEAMVRLREVGVGIVLLTPRDGTGLALEPEGAWRITPPTVPTATVISEVGWTDATVAGTIDVLISGGDFEAALRRGIAAGRATIVTPGTMLCEAATVTAFEEQVRLERIDIPTAG
jgi:1-phosphofructokinase